MAFIIENFDVSKVVFEDRYTNDGWGTTTLYFIAPKEWLGDRWSEAVHAEISLEFPLAHQEPAYTTAMISPTMKVDDDCYSDYDWVDLELSYEDIDRLMNLAAS